MTNNDKPTLYRFTTEEAKTQRLTVFLSAPSHMLRKLEWESARFDQLHHAEPPEPMPILYAAFDAFLTAQSLGEWTCQTIIRSRRARGERTDRSTIMAEILEQVPLQAIAIDVANTTKHFDFRQDNAPGVRAEFDHLKGGGIRELWNLSFYGPHGDEQALLLFRRLIAEWREYLISQGMLFRGT